MERCPRLSGLRQVSPREAEGGLSKRSPGVMCVKHQMIQSGLPDMTARLSGSPQGLHLLILS